MNASICIIAQSIGRQNLFSLDKKFQSVVCTLCTIFEVLDEKIKQLAHRGGRTPSLQIAGNCEFTRTRKSLTLYPIELGGRCLSLKYSTYIHTLLPFPAELKRSQTLFSLAHPQKLKSSTPLAATATKLDIPGPGSSSSSFY